MSGLRVRLTARDRSELLALPGPDVVIGSDPDADLVLDHPSVAPTHARLILRRGRVIIADLGHSPTGVTRGSDRLHAPVTLNPGGAVGVGDLRLEAWVGPVILHASAHEHECPDPGLRRFPDFGGARPGEHLYLEPGVASASWEERARAVALREGDHLFEPLPPGLRWSRLERAVREGRVSLPTEALVVLAVELLSAYGPFARTFGPHGLIDGRRVHLGLDGSLRILLPGPVDHFRDPAQLEALAPERRYGLRPTHEADVYSLGVMLGALDPESRIPGLSKVLPGLLAEEPEGRRAELPWVVEVLRAQAHQQGLDPAAHHLARAVRVVEPDPARRISYVGAERAALRERRQGR